MATLSAFFKRCLIGYPSLKVAKNKLSSPVTKRKPALDFQRVIHNYNNDMKVCCISFTGMETNSDTTAFANEKSKRSSESCSPESYSPSHLSISPPIKITKLSDFRHDSSEANRACTSTDTHYQQDLTMTMDTSLPLLKVLTENNAKANPAFNEDIFSCDKEISHTVSSPQIPESAACAHHLLAQLSFSSEQWSAEESNALSTEILTRIEKRKLKLENKLTSEKQATFSLSGWCELPFASETVLEEETTAKTTKSDEQVHRTKKSKKNKAMEKNSQNAKRPIPNYFVAIQINDQTIIENLKRLQEHLVTKNEQLKGALISPATMHLTLTVMHLDPTDEEMIKNARNALEASHKMLYSDLNANPVNLVFQGLGNFNDQVLFARIREGEDLDRLNFIARKVQETFEEQGVVLLDKDFKAHLTIMKLSKLHGIMRKKIKKIKKEYYEEYEDMSFGIALISNLQLLSMKDKKDENGYYKCLLGMSFTETNKITS